MERRGVFEDKSVLVTGGTGSFGRAFIARLLHEHNPKRVIVFSRDEWKQWEMRESNPQLKQDPRVRFFIGDVRDKDRLRRALADVQIVVHAAALKQVPVAEYNPTEFILTNVFGAMNVLDASLDAGVERVIALSTDKAVNPVNLYGATKLCSDKLFVSGNAYSGKKPTRLSVVRYGNVLGSRGSIIPFWRDLILKGAESLPITDLRMTRFWITLDQAVDFVVSCATNMVGGEIFVPKIPSMKIVDLAAAMAPKVPLEVTGIREGEKLHELMISYEDSRLTFEFPNYYAIASHSHIRERIEKLRAEEGLAPVAMNRVEEGFVYASNTNTEWLSAEELQKTLRSSVYKQEGSSPIASHKDSTVVEY